MMLGQETEKIQKVLLIRFDCVVRATLNSALDCKPIAQDIQNTRRNHCHASQRRIMRSKTPAKKQADRFPDAGKTDGSSAPRTSIPGSRPAPNLSRIRASDFILLRSLSYMLSDCLGISLRITSRTGVFRPRSICIYKPCRYQFHDIVCSQN